MRTDMTKLTVVFRNCANALNCCTCERAVQWPVTCRAGCHVAGTVIVAHMADGQTDLSDRKDASKQQVNVDTNSFQCPPNTSAKMSPRGGGCMVCLRRHLEAASIVGLHL
jgi:hypothetical protein